MLVYANPFPMKSIKLGVRAKQKGIAYRTAWNWYKAGRLPAHGYQTRLDDPDGTLDAPLGAYADLDCQAEHGFFADIARDCDPAVLKLQYLARFGLTTRQFNVIAISAIPTR
ncbi:hypothetical protein SAMN05421693_10554 [Ectothiorhodospira magna]|uniref:Uncharacterized protein n=1 Tax=Ectothiorhodospira magna TaxID=867345 RepID=A0A1H9AGW4_9GAMM|nr:hypothetical protein [Ectothiorhodospira magna]SEP75717.1 hypothetical protein SAMN05421693_10554 [Ectothiorhodospira magna]